MGVVRTNLVGVVRFEFVASILARIQWEGCDAPCGGEGVGAMAWVWAEIPSQAANGGMGVCGRAGEGVWVLVWGCEGARAPTGRLPIM